MYAVTMTGTTGKSVGACPMPCSSTWIGCARCARGAGMRRLRHPHAANRSSALRGHVDGVVVGSALVEVLERAEDPQPWLRSLRGAGT